MRGEVVKLVMLALLIPLSSALAVLALGVLDATGAFPAPESFMGASVISCERTGDRLCCMYAGLDDEGDPCVIGLCRTSQGPWRVAQARCMSRAALEGDEPEPDVGL